MLAMALGRDALGRFVGRSVYNPTTDPSMQNHTVSVGVQAWSNAGDTRNGVDVAVSYAGVRRFRQ